METKELYDGSIVPVETPTKIIDGERHLLTEEEIEAMQEEAATLAIAKEEVQPVTAVTLEQKITAILKQFKQDRMNGKGLIQELDAIVTQEMKGLKP